jgi:3-hydroxyisobutyrate dehydrogenase
MSTAPEIVGFIGLGQMGNPMAANIAKGGATLLCYDQAGTEERLPPGATAAADLAAVVKGADTIILSLPDGKIVNAVANEIAAVDAPRAKVVIDTSTIGPDAAKSAAATLKAAGITYIDAPVSGGRGGAIAGTITLMWAGPEELLESHRKIVDSFCGNPFHVGDEAGHGQTVKLLNNFLSGTALAATTEAVLFGLSQGLEMKKILDVVAVSTGTNSAIVDKFPKRILTGTFDAGFFCGLQNKDIQLYFTNAEKTGTPNRVGTEISAIWQQTTDTLGPQADITEIYELMRKKTNVGQ